MRDSVDDFVHCTQADWEVADRVTEGLDQSPRGAMQTGKFTAQGAQARAITGLLLAWHLRCELSPTALALALLKDAMVDCHLDRRQLDHLMRVVGAQRDHVVMAPGTGAGLKEMDLGGPQ